MSDSNQARLAVLQHARRQAAASRILSVISERVAESPYRAIDADLSLKLQTELSDRLKRMRAVSKLPSSRFASAEQAVNEFCRRGNELGAQTLVQFYSSSGGSGFFEGLASPAFVLAWLESAREGLTIITPNLAAGVMIDAVLDDPLYGNFFEVEWW